MKICIILRIYSVLVVCLYLMFIQQGLIFIYIFFSFQIHLVNDLKTESPI